MHASAQVWANCRLFNRDGSDIVRLANSLESDFRARWKSASLPAVATPAVGPRVSEQAPARGRCPKRPAAKRKRILPARSRPDSDSEAPPEDASDTDFDAERRFSKRRRLNRRQERAAPATRPDEGPTGEGTSFST